MKNAKDTLKAVALVALLALYVGQASSRSTATAQGGGNGNQREEFIFGTVGLTPTQTARLNVVNAATGGRPQTRVLKFLDSAGDVIVDSSGNPVTKAVTLGPGESDYLDLDGADIPGGANRVQIRALDPQCATCGRETPHSIVQTLELIDNLTHRTEVLYAPAQFLQPDGPPSNTGPFGMVGITDGQTARLSVAVPPDPVRPEGPPIRVLLGFVRADGQPVNPCADCPPAQTEVLLRPGESASFDLPADLVLAADESRAQIRPVVRPEGPPNRLIPTLEVMNDATAKTAVLYAPSTRNCGAN
jgi:hypothetical protein